MLSNLSSVILRKTEQFYARRYTNCHPFGKQEASSRIIPTLISGFEPRARYGNTRVSAAVRP